MPDKPAQMVVISTDQHGVLWGRSLENGSVTFLKEDRALLQFLYDADVDFKITVR